MEVKEQALFSRKGQHGHECCFGFNCDAGSDVTCAIRGWQQSVPEKVTPCMATNDMRPIVFSVCGADESAPSGAGHAGRYGLQVGADRGEEAILLPGGPAVLRDQAAHQLPLQGDAVEFPLQSAAAVRLQSGRRLIKTCSHDIAKENVKALTALPPFSVFRFNGHCAAPDLKKKKKNGAIVVHFSLFCNVKQITVVGPQNNQLIS